MLGGHDHHYVQLVWLVASVFGVAALAALVVIYRRAARRAELEQAEQIIAEHDQSSLAADLATLPHAATPTARGNLTR